MSKVLTANPPEILEKIFEKYPDKVLIEASAGTGKTYTITYIVNELILRGTDINKILVMTFTNKATNELKDRIRVKLEETLRETTDANQSGLLKTALSNFESAQISTIHSFSHNFLKKHSFQAGESFDAEIVKDEKEIVKECMRDLSRNEFLNDPVYSGIINSILNLTAKIKYSSLKKILEKFYNNTAFAGFYVTYHYFDDIIDFVNKNEDFIFELEDFYTSNEPCFNKTYSPLKYSIPFLKGLIGLDKHNISHIVRAADLFYSHIKETKTYSLKDKLDQIVKPVFKKDYSFESIENTSILRTSGFKALSEIIEVMKNNIAPNPLDLSFKILLEPLKQKVEKYKTDHNLISYDDLISRLHDYVVNDEVFANLLDTSFEAVIIDEFQDTDIKQWEIIKRVFINNEKKSLYLIGDPKQAIYRFRGADIFSYNNAKQTVKKTVSLDRNYRSSSDLIESANFVFGDAAGEYFTETDPDMDPPVNIVKYSDEIKCGNPGVSITPGRKPVVLLMKRDNEGKSREWDDSWYQETITEEIQNLMSDPPLITVKNETRKLRYGDIMVLFFKNKNLQSLGEQLRRFGIPRTKYKSQTLFRTNEALDIYTLLCAIESPENHRKKLLALNSDFFRIPVSDFKNITGFSYYPEINKLFENWSQKASNREFEDLFADIIGQTGIYMRKYAIHKDLRAVSNYKQIFNYLLSKNSSRRFDLNDLIRILYNKIHLIKDEDDEQNIEQVASDENSVQLMTIHNAKGLESPVVFLGDGFTAGGQKNPKLFVVNGKLMTTYSKKDYTTKAVDNRIGEVNTGNTERQLYVGYTRASHLLYLPYVADPEDEESPVFIKGVYNDFNMRLNKLRKADPERFDEYFELRFDNEISGKFGKLRLSSEPETSGAVEIPGEISFPGINREVLAAAEAGDTFFSYSSVSRMLYNKDNEPEVEDFIPGQDDEVEMPGKQTDLPSGAEFGSLIHEILAEIPFDSVKINDFTAFSSDQIISGMINSGLMRYYPDFQHAEYVAKLVFNALNSVLPRIGCSFSELKKVTRERDFMIKWSDIHKNAFSSFKNFRFSPRNAYAKGYFDAVFEFDDKFWILDWKTDNTEDFSFEKLKEHTEKHYKIQQIIYTVALLQILNVKTPEDYEQKFGGLYYVYLKRLNRNSDGIVFSRIPAEELFCET